MSAANFLLLGKLTRRLYLVSSSRLLRKVDSTNLQVYVISTVPYTLPIIAITSGQPEESSFLEVVEKRKSTITTVA